MSRPPRTMGAVETAVIVFRYLEGQHYSKSLKAFKREAKDILSMAPQVPRGLKPLAVMLGEYVALREADERRAHLFAKNPALRDMFQIIETQSAALQPTYAGQFTGAAPPGAGGQAHTNAEALSPEQEDYYSGAPAAGDLNGDFSALQGNFSTFGGGHNGVQGSYGAAQQAAGNTPGASPRKTTRKRAPKRKMPAGHDAAAALDQLGDGFGGSMIDLLNQPINERALETLLAGDWQGRFAEGLASCINDRLAPQQQQEQLDQLAAQSAAAALPVYDEVEMNTWMASLTGDPGMAALLEPIVAPSQGMDACDESGGMIQDMPDAVHLDEPHDSSPSQQHPLCEASPEMQHVQGESQQGAACSSQEPDQAGTPTLAGLSHAAKPAALPGEPPHAPNLAAAAVGGAPRGAFNVAAPEQVPVQGSGSDARPPAATQKARRRLSLDPGAFPPGAAAAPERLPALQEETGAASAMPHVTSAQPVQDQLFASPYQKGSRKDGAHSGGRRGTMAEASSGTPKLSVLLSDPTNTLDGFSAHVLAAKTRSAVPVAMPSAAAKNGAEVREGQRETDAEGQVAGAQQSTHGKGANSMHPSQQKGRSGSTARVVIASNGGPQTSGDGFFGDPVSTLDGFQGDILAASARAVPAQAVTAKTAKSAKTPAARQGAHERQQQQLVQPNAARSRAAQKPVAQQRRGRKGGMARSVPAARDAPTTHGASIFGDPINTLDGFSGDVLSARAAAASAARPPADAAASAPSSTGNISFLDTMPTLDDFPADDGDAAAARPHAPTGEASQPLPGNRGGAAAAAAAPQTLSPIPLRIGPDGRLSSGPVLSHKADSSTGAVSAEWRGTRAGGRAVLPDQARQGREAVQCGQERGIWRTEESMDAVLNQDAFRDPSPAPEQATAAAQRLHSQAAAAGSGAPAVEAPATDFSGLQARIGSVVKGSSCGQQQGGGNARALSSIFAGGASAESLDAFMRSLKY
ncbi:g7752 [Coccomyxa elongata]